MVLHVSVRNTLPSLLSIEIENLGRNVAKCNTILAILDSIECNIWKILCVC